MSKIDDELDQIERDSKKGILIFLESPIRGLKLLLQKLNLLLKKIKNEYNNVQKTFAYIIILNLTLGSFYLFSYKVIGSHTKYQKLEIELIEKNKCNCISNSGEILYFDCNEDIPSECIYKSSKDRTTNVICKCIDVDNQNIAHDFDRRTSKSHEDCIEKTYSEKEVISVIEKSDVLLGLAKEKKYFRRAYKEKRMDLDYRGFGLTYQELFLSLIISLLCYVGIKIF